MVTFQYLSKKLTNKDLDLQGTVSEVIRKLHLASSYGHMKPRWPPITYETVLAKDTGLTNWELETTLKDRSV